MTRYTVWLWPGFGAELKPFIVEASYEQEALETVGESLKGTGFTISGDEYMDMVAEYVADGYTEDEAEGMVSEQYYPINGGEYYLFILNARIDEVSESASKKRRGSANRTVVPYGGGYVSLPGSYNGKPGKRKDAERGHRRLFGSKNVGYRDLPKKARDHPGHIPGYKVRLPNGTVAYAESEVSLLDGQEPGSVSYWTSVCDDDGNWWDVAFTFDLDYLKATPWEAVDWSGHISEVRYDPDSELYASANRGIGGRRR